MRLSSQVLVKVRPVKSWESLSARYNGGAINLKIGGLTQAALSRLTN